MMLQKPFAHAQLVTAVSTLVNQAASRRVEVGKVVVSGKFAFSTQSAAHGSWHHDSVWPGSSQFERGDGVTARFRFLTFLPMQWPARRHQIRLARRLPTRRWRNPRVIGSQPHRSRLLALQSRQISPRCIGCRGTTTHQADPVTASLCFLEIQGSCCLLHFFLQAFDRLFHPAETREHCKSNTCQSD